MNKALQKKSLQLGMNSSTASQRLVKDILFKFVDDGKYVCHHCDKPMTRQTFSIEHMKPWLDSEDPVGIFFDLGNISFSHITCNIGAGRKGKMERTPEFYAKRAASHNEASKRYNAKPEVKALRRQQYKDGLRK